jgi:hypothetical protein
MTGPRNEPALTGLGRLPMHSVTHRERLPLDRTWRFQLLSSPEQAVGAEWGEAHVPSVWTMSGTWSGLATEARATLSAAVRELIVVEPGTTAQSLEIARAN